MDLGNKPTTKRTRIDGGYMVVGYGSGGGIWIPIAGGICNGGRWQGDDDGAAAA